MTAENRAGVTTQYLYYRENQLRAIIDPSGARTTMTYDGDQMRRTRQTASGVTTYVWDGSDYLQERAT
jgi:YD repeat-containing protein